jgi:serine/threonine protein kinase
MASRSPSASVGALIAGKYRVERHIGAGGMGYVVAARHEVLGELYAIKILADASDETLRLRFLREAQAVGRITSAHVAKVYDVGELPDGTAFMVMEFLEGEDLDAKIQREGPMGLAQAVDYLIHACEALAEAHGLGIVHRDVKPGNLFLTKSRSGNPLVKLLDFGIAKEAELGGERITQLTHEGSVLGSPQFMAPEQLVSSRDVDARADIWSLGVTLFDLLTCEAAFDGNTMADLYAAILRNDPRSLCELRPDLPRDLERVVERCLEKDAYDRYDTVAELVKDLASFAPKTAQTSIARITKNVAPIAATVSGEDLVATHKQDRNPVAPLAETLIPLVRPAQPTPPRRQSLNSAPTTIMEVQSAPPAHALATTMVQTPAPSAEDSVPKGLPTAAMPHAHARPAKKRPARLPLVIFVALSIAVLIAGGYRYYRSSSRNAGQEVSNKRKKPTNNPSARSAAIPT